MMFVTDNAQLVKRKKVELIMSAGSNSISNSSSFIMSANKPAFKCRDDHTQPRGYGPLVPGHPRTHNNGGLICIIY